MVREKNIIDRRFRLRELSLEVVRVNSSLASPVFFSPIWLARSITCPGPAANDDIRSNDDIRGVAVGVTSLSSPAVSALSRPELRLRRLAPFPPVPRCANRLLALLVHFRDMLDPVVEGAREADLTKGGGAGTIGGSSCSEISTNEILRFLSEASGSSRVSAASTSASKKDGQDAQAPSSMSVSSHTSGNSSSMSTKSTPSLESSSKVGGVMELI